MTASYSSFVVPNQATNTAIAGKTAGDEQGDVNQVVDQIGDHYECSLVGSTGVNYIDGGVTVRDATVIDANQSADLVNTTGNETISKTVLNDAVANSS